MMMNPNLRPDPGQPWGEPILASAEGHKVFPGAEGGVTIPVLTAEELVLASMMQDLAKQKGEALTVVEALVRWRKLPRAEQKRTRDVYKFLQGGRN